MVSSRVSRQVEAQALTLRGMQSFRQQLPKLNEFTPGPAVQFQSCAAGRFYFRYISVSAPLRLYCLRIMASNYSGGAVTASTIGAGLYRPTTPPPPDSTDFTGPATDAAPALSLIEASTTIYTADTVTPAASLSFPADLPSSWGVFYFQNEPWLLPGNDYYLGFSTYGGSGTFGFWTDNFTGSNLTANGWYSSSGVVTADNAMISNITPNARGLPVPACILQSKYGMKRSGYSII